MEAISIEEASHVMIELWIDAPNLVLFPESYAPPNYFGGASYECGPITKWRRNFTGFVCLFHGNISLQEWTHPLNQPFDSFKESSNKDIHQPLLKNTEKRLTTRNTSRIWSDLSLGNLWSLRIISLFHWIPGLTHPRRLFLAVEHN